MALFIKRLLVGAVACLLFVVAQAGAASADDSVTIADPGFRRCLTDRLRLLPGDALTETQLASIATLTCDPYPEDQPLTANLNGIENLTNLESLTLSGVRVTDLAPLADLPKLQRIGLLNLDIDDLSPLEPLALTTLWVEGLPLENVSFLRQLPSLSALYLRGVDVDLAPVAELTGLTTLQLSALGANPDYSFIGGLPHLTTLSLNAGSRSHLGTIGAPPKLTDLTISGSALTEVNLVSAQTNLRTLALSTPALPDLNALRGLRQLRELQLNPSSAKSLDPLTGMTSLNKLTIYQGAVTDAKALAGLTGLETLSIWSTPLASLPSLAGLRALTSLDLRSNKLTALPDLSALDALVTLDASGNQIATLPTRWDLDRLTSLYLYSNRLTALPDLAGLPALTTLDASVNQITSLPARWELPDLASLNLNVNRLGTLPDLSSLDALTTLSLGDNQLSRLQLSGLPALKDLVASGNQLTSVGTFTDVPALARVNLSGNAIRDLSGLVGLPALREIDLTGNRIGDVSGLPANLKVTAALQWVTVPAVATINQPIAVPISGFGGTMPSVTPDQGTSLAQGKLTYTTPGTHNVRFDQTYNGSAFSGTFTQKAGPDRAWTKTYPAELGGVPRVGYSIGVAMKHFVPEEESRVYKWYRDGKVIPGADAGDYVIAPGDVGHRFKASVTVIKDGYATTTVWTKESVKALIGSFSGDPTLAGKRQTGQVLTVTTNLSPKPDRCTNYRWERNYKRISGATKSTYTLTASDLGKRIRAYVTCSAKGIETTRLSTPNTGKISQGPVRASTPTVVGTPKAGQKLTIAKGSWGPGTITFSYQWLRDGRSISKATKSSYTLTASDVGHQVSVKLKGDRTSYTAVTRTSASITVA